MPLGVGVKLASDHGRSGAEVDHDLLLGVVLLYCEATTQLAGRRTD